MSKAKGFRFEERLVVKIRQFPLTNSALVTLAVHECANDPSKLVRALQSRITADEGEDANVIRIGVNLSDDTHSSILSLSRMTKLTSEEVVRLAVEAQLKHL